MKVDLAELELWALGDLRLNESVPATWATRKSIEHANELLALIRVARAAKDCENCTSDAERTHAWAHLRAALSDIEDSANER